MLENVLSTNLYFHHHYGGRKIRANTFFSKKPIFFSYLHSKTPNQHPYNI